MQPVCKGDEACDAGRQTEMLFEGKALMYNTERNIKIIMLWRFI